MKKHKRKNKNDTQRELDQDHLAIHEQASTDKTTSKIMMFVGTLGIIGGIVGVYLLLGTGITDSYFQSKLKENTIYAESPESNQNTTDTETSDDEDTDNTDHDPNNDIDDVSEEPVDSDALGDLLDIRPTEILIDREDLIEYLGDMSDSEFEVFIRTMVDVINEHTGESGDKTISSVHSDTHIDLATLHEAYVRAEREFPNQINSSKRIQLINELNAIDYNYYVVEHGDTLGDLSRALEVPMGQFIEINGIHDADMIRIGEILLIPIE